jgi:hypothetical protein
LKSHVAKKQKKQKYKENDVNNGLFIHACKLYLKPFIVNTEVAYA